MANDHARLAELRAALAAVEASTNLLGNIPVASGLGLLRRREDLIFDLKSWQLDMEGQLAALEGRLTREEGEAK